MKRASTLISLKVCGGGVPVVMHEKEIVECAIALYRQQGSTRAHPARATSVSVMHSETSRRSLSVTKETPQRTTLSVREECIEVDEVRVHSQS